jgi:hypothetical protein
MKKTALLLAAMALPVLGQSSPSTTQQNEVLVLTTSTRVDVGIEQRKGIEVQNLGPNAIYCKVSNTTPTAVLNKARRLATNESWAIDLPPGYRISCIAATANQVTGAATIVTEVR